MAETGTQPKELTPAQVRAVAAIVAARDLREAAKQCNVAERTLWRWCELEPFKLALAEAEANLIDFAMRRTLQLQELAIDTIAAILADTSTPAGIRLRAALGVLEQSVKLRELRNLEVRLLALEAAASLAQ